MTDDSGAAGNEAVGIDIGGTKMLGVVIDPQHPAAVIRSKRLLTPSGPDALLAAIEDLAGGLVSSPHAAIGVGIPGLVDSDGWFRAGPNLPGIVDLAIGDELRRRLGRDVVVDNDATCAAAAEFRVGAGAGHRHGMLLTIGTGIGGGVVLDGAIRHGANGFAGEAGHMMVDAAGPRCPCGRRGCWEAYASGSGLGRLARKAAAEGNLVAVLERAGGVVDAIRGEHVVAAARGGDTEVAGVLDEFAWWLGVGIGNLVTLLDLPIVVLGGGVMADGDLLLDRVRAVVADQLMSAAYRPPVTITAARMGPEAGAIGAALLAVASA